MAVTKKNLEAKIEEYLKLKAEADAADCEGGSLYPSIYYGSEAESTRERCYELAEYLKDY